STGLAQGIPAITVGIGLIGGVIRGLSLAEFAEGTLLSAAGTVAANTFGYAMLGGAIGLGAGMLISYIDYKYNHEAAVNSLLKSMNGTERMIQPESHFFKESPKMEPLDTTPQIKPFPSYDGWKLK